jgi:hypothetical protein
MIDTANKLIFGTGPGLVEQPGTSETEGLASLEQQSRLTVMFPDSDRGDGMKSSLHVAARK